MDGKLPNFLIIGAMRSGTTSLAHHLQEHPDVFVAPGKEVHYFDFQFGKGTAWYQEMFSGAREQRWIGEATPTYMYDPDVAPRMASLLPESKLIAILRNPVDRAYSHYWHNRVRNRENLDFAEAIAVEPARLSTPDRQTRNFYSYLDRGRYFRQLQRVMQYYPRDALLVLFFEELRDMPNNTFQSICRFLQLDGAFLPRDLGVAINQNVSFRFPELRKIGKRMPRILKRAIGKMNIRNSKYAPMDAEIREKLLNIFEAENAVLESWLGRDLSIWKR